MPSRTPDLYFHRWSELPIKLILSGSHITAMQQLESGEKLREIEEGQVTWLGVRELFR